MRMEIIEKKRGKLARGQGGHQRGHQGGKRKWQNLVAGNTISFNKNRLSKHRI